MTKRKPTDAEAKDAGDIADGTAVAAKGPSVATQLVQLAEKDYDLGCTAEGEPYALPKKGPPIVRLLRGGRQSLRAELADAYYTAAGSAASQNALADACTVIEGRAQRVEPIELHLRVAEHQGSLVLDLGDATGRCVVLTAAGWQLVHTPPVRFRRTALTGALPEPTAGGDFAELWDALNVAERYRPLVLAVLVAALMPAIPHPVVLLTGEQGTGKSTATARLASILDPSPAQLRKPPRDLDTWTTAAAGSWVVALDNLSGIQDWLSDALCRACTGDGDVRRRLYTDGDLHVIAFRRVPIVNGIDLGALRGDLADRLVHLQLDRIAAGQRRRDEEMAAAWRHAHPKVLGALLDLAVKVLAVLPLVSLAELPRMADLARVIAAVDKVNGTEGLGTYLGLRNELANDAATSDPVLVALAEKITEVFTGTSTKLLATITPSRGPDGFPWKPPKGWPATARSLTACLARQAPTLRHLGWSVDKRDRGSDPRGKAVVWELEPPSESKSVEQVEDQEPAGEWTRREPGGPVYRRNADGDAGKMRSVNDAADAATRHDHGSSQVKHGAPSAATGAASVPQHPRDAARAATPGDCGSDAAPVAADAAPTLSSANEDHAASAALPRHIPTSSSVTPGTRPWVARFAPDPTEEGQP